MKEFTSIAHGLIGLLLVAEVLLLVRFLAWTRGPRGGRPVGRLWRATPLLLALAFAVPATLLARGGALAPGLPGAGMPWERVTDATDPGTSARAGERAYLNRCSPCHLPGGEGLPPSYPPLAGSAILAGPVDEHVRVVLWGSRGVRAPRPGAARMPGFHGAASDAELAAILTYERHAWAPGAEPVRPSDVARGRGLGAEEGLARP
ncbi:MAG: cytochrome c [Candidatus Eisenbacteria bacterium]